MGENNSSERNIAFKINGRLLTIRNPFFFLPFFFRPIAEKFLFTRKKKEALFSFNPTKVGGDFRSRYLTTVGSPFFEKQEFVEIIT